MSKTIILFIGMVFIFSFLYGQNQRLPHFFNEMIKPGNHPEIDRFILSKNEPSFGPHEEYITSWHGDWNNIPVATPGNRPLDAQERQTLQAIIRDFQVNENAGGATQYAPAVAVDGSGKFVVVWQDNRNGDGDIFAQRYGSDGTAISNNFKVNDDSGSAWQYWPAVAVDGSGNFVVVWEDSRNGNWDVYAQRYGSDGAAIGNNFKVNDDSGNAGQYSPAVAVDGLGNFVVIWQDNRNGAGDIYAQRYGSDGTAIGNNFKVNDDSGSAGQYSPAVAVDASGNFVIVWEDSRNGNWDVYAQRYGSDGTAIGNNFKVNDDSGSAGRSSIAVAVDGSGNFVVVWQDIRNGNWDVYAQRYGSDGTAIGNNFKVNDDSGSAGRSSIAVAVDGSGNFVVVWQDIRNGDGDIYAQRYGPDGTAIGNNFKVNDDSGSAWQYWPAVAVDSSGNFVAVWKDNRNGAGDIYVQRAGSDGTAIGNNFKVNDDSGSADQYWPAVAVDDSGNFVVVWKDYRNGDGDIYAQRYGLYGTAIGNNFKINDDSGSADQYWPAVAVDGLGNFVVVWQDNRNGAGDIYAQRYGSDGTAIGNNFKVNDDSGNAGQYSPAIAVDDSGNFVVVWQDRRDVNGDIYAQRYEADGAAIGKNFKVNDDNGYSEQYNPSVAVDDAGNFVVVWEDERNGDWDIYLQRYGSDSTAIGNNLKVNDYSGSASYFDPPSIAMDGSGNFVVVWEDYRNGDWDIYAQRYGTDGKAIGVNFKINDDSSKVYKHSCPTIALDSLGNFVVVWTDNRNGDWDIYAQRYAAGGTALGQNFVATMETKKSQFSPDVKLWRGRIYNTWVSNHAGETGYDIWANVLDWNNPTAIENESQAVVTNFKLAQNYPNPFNPTTTIRYDLPKAANVKLTVYNLLGQKVCTLVNTNQPAGQYQVQWSGRDAQGKPVASGVYVYKLQARTASGENFVQVRKMVLMK